jgi:hypothetical protein
VCSCVRLFGYYLNKEQLLPGASVRVRLQSTDNTSVSEAKESIGGVKTSNFDDNLGENSYDGYELLSSVKLVSEIAQTVRLSGDGEHGTVNVESEEEIQKNDEKSVNIEKIDKVCDSFVEIYFKNIR